MQMFNGVWPALLTPQTDDNEVNIDVLRQLVDYHIDKGVDGFYVGGSTGEGVFMPNIHRKLVVEIVMNQVSGRVPVIVHAGSMILDDAVDLARHARDHGASGVSSILPPLYDTIDSIIMYFESLAASVSDIAFLPYLLNPQVDTVVLLKRAMHIPNLAGTKYTGSNMFEFRQLIDLGERSWTMFSGMDEQCVYAAMAGSSGNIGSTLNFMPGVYKAIHNNLSAGDYPAAHDLQIRANGVTAIMVEYSFMGALKAVMERLGFPCGVPRLPRLPISEDECLGLFQKLDQTDFDDLVSM